MSNWQPIETAPRDGTAVLVWVPGAREGAEGAWGRHGKNTPSVAVAKYDDYKWRPEEERWTGDIVEFESGWESTGSYNVTVALKPTHWMPLPEPPVG